MLLFDLVTGRDIILECYLGDVARRIIILLFSGHVTTCVTVSPGVIIISGTRHHMRNGVGRYYYIIILGTRRRYGMGSPVITLLLFYWHVMIYLEYH